jgi:N-acetylmuramic acid 6-phosphate etherase
MFMQVNLSALVTEQRNLKSTNIDQMSTIEIVSMMNDEDKTVAQSVEKVLPQIAAAIDVIHNALQAGGRLIYVGAGTSGRLGVLDAAECPPTFCTPPELVQGLIAGGERAMFKAVEGAEDDRSLAQKDLQNRSLSDKDVVVGIAASGRTPYVIGALEFAKSTGAATIALSCNQNARISEYADHHIEVVVGPEVLTGSTRLKAGTAQKMVLNMLTTATMIKLGKVYDNLMVDLHATNEKLIERSRRIITTITGVSYEEATDVLNETSQSVKPAIIMIEAGVSYTEAKQALEKNHHLVRNAIHDLKKDAPHHE